MAKRRYGLGGITHRADGRWEGRIRFADGSRHSVYARDRVRLITRLREERWRLEWGIPVPARGLLLGGFLRHWLEVVRTRLRQKTFDAYELNVRRIEGELGYVPLARLNPQIVQGAYGRLLARGLSTRTVFQTHAVLHRALKQARHWGLMHTNPTELVAAPRPRPREMSALSAEQLQILLVSSQGTRWHSLWIVLSTAGLRIGEALGLKWTDVDLVHGRLQVKRALQRQRGRGLVFVEPKTPHSRRLVHLSQLALEALRVQRCKTESDLVFPNELGEAQDSSSVTAALAVALQRARLPRIRVHDLRHTWASVLLEAGAHPKLVQDLLGHSTVALTLNTYRQVTAGLSDQAARAMDRILGSIARAG